MTAMRPLMVVRRASDTSLKRTLPPAAKMADMGGFVTVYL